VGFLADESVDRQIVDRLREEDHTVRYVAEMEPGISDDTVLRLANERADLLLTADKDFGELVFRQGRFTWGILLVRLAGMSPIEKGQLVAAAVSQHGLPFPPPRGTISVSRKENALWLQPARGGTEPASGRASMASITSSVDTAVRLPPVPCSRSRGEHGMPRLWPRESGAGQILLRVRDHAGCRLSPVRRTGVARGQVLL
jgi:predicted nuclease of predicted toxin-antitoxin system